MAPQPLEPSRWRFRPSDWDGKDDCVAVGGDLEPGTVIDAYRNGAFPMPTDGVLAWWSPVRRGVLWPAEFHTSRSLRRSQRRFTVTYDTDFVGVIDACADPSRRGAWIDDSIRHAYIRLHELGWAHSVETRDADGELVGGLYGLQVGRLFAGESMFHRATDASKVALGALAHLQTGGLIDVQWSTPHLASLGVTEVGRPEYLRLIRALVAEPGPTW
jgi:leucyl/phenylalanyl-tRNA--protein transferase